MTATVACIGIAVHDLVYNLEGEPVAGSKNFATSMVTTAGGPVVNAARAVVGLGGSALVAVRVGSDPAGDAVLEGLEAGGVCTDYVERIGGVATPVSSVMIHGDGERTIVNFTDDAVVDTAGRSVDAAVDAADVVLTDVRWIAGAGRAVARARTTGKPVVVDFDLTSTEGGRDLIGQATHVVFSSDALTAIDPARALHDVLIGMAGTCDAVVGVTLGTAGSLWVVEGGTVEVPALEVPVVSTLGAGDVFHGAFALAIAEGRPILDAARFATAAAGVWCTIEPGSGVGLMREDVDRMEVTGWLH